MFIVVAALAIAVLSSFVAYEFMYVSISFPENDIFLGKTINASELYHPDRFTWYTYDQFDSRVSPSPHVIRMTMIFDNQTYDGTPALHERDIYTGFGTPTTFFAINDMYYYEDGRWMAGQVYSYSNVTQTNISSFNCNGSVYHKYVFMLKDDGQIAPQGRETITVGNETYVCDRYYQPDGEEILWFASSIPVPVKVQSADGRMTATLMSWG